MMLKVYTAGYMTGKGSKRNDWRIILVEATEFEAIRWLHPGVPKGVIPGKGNPNIYSARDIIQVRIADMIVAYFDLRIARGLGTAHEVGMACALGKPIIMIDRSPEVGSLDFQRQCALSVVLHIQEAAEIISFAAQGLS